MSTLTTDILRSRRIAIGALALGLLGLSIGYLAMFPQLEQQLQSFAGQLPDFYEALVGNADLTTAEGYVRTQVYALVAPLVVAGVAIATAAGIAKQERAVTLTAYYLAPVSRARLAWSFLAAAWTTGLAGGLAVFLGVVTGAPLAGASLGILDVAAATVPLVGFTWAASAVAWTAAAATGSPAVATGAGWGFVGTSFLANSIGEMVTDLEVLAELSPWSWYGAGAPITDGVDLTALLLFALAALLVPIGVRQFRARGLQL